MKKGLKNLSKTALIALIEQQQASLIQKGENEFRLQSDKERLQVEKAHLKVEKTYLEAQIAELKRMLFGQSRERFIVNPEQMLLPFAVVPEIKEQQQEAVQQTITYTRDKQKKNHPGRIALPDHLPVEEVKIYPEGDLSNMRCIGKEITEELERIPAKLYIKRYIRYKYAPKSGEGEHLIASLPERVINKGIPGAGLLAGILEDKYVEHLPLDRQLKRFKKEGVKISPSTINNWVKKCAEKLLILYQNLIDDIQDKGYLQADETTLKVLDSRKKGATHQGYFWVYHDPIERMVLFDYQSSRGYKSTECILGDFKGYLQSDGYSVYAKIAKNSQVTPVACWAHVRREFKEAISNDKARAEKALVYIQQLYAIERQARKKEMKPAQRKELRIIKALPVINEMGKWIIEQQSQVLPKSTIGKAFTYCTNRWTALSNYMLDGTLEIDNNLTENALRGVALGRKNYLFAGSHDAAGRAAIFYTFVANCQMHQVNAYDWFKYALENIMDTPVKELHKLYPQNLKKILEKA